jgi:predicted dehydrogenase
MSAPIRIGIVGCGQIAQHHMRTYATIAEAKMVAFCDANPEALAAAVAAYGPAEGYSDFRDLIARDDIDAVDVCLHNNLHMPLTLAALRAGKHVYCEKPMAGSYRDAETMLKTAREVGKHLHIQLATLYANETRAAKELIDAGELGDLYHARSTGFRRRGRPYVDGYGTANFVKKQQASGGALYDMGVYHISQVLYLMGNPVVERISGKTYQRVGRDEKRQVISGFDVEEMAVGLVRFQGDRSMDLVESWAVNLDEFGSSYVLGDKAGIRLSPFGLFKNVGNVELSSTANLGASRARWNSVVGDGAEYGESQAMWIAALQDKVPLLPTAEIALNTMLISEGIYLSHAQNREVTADEVRSASVSTAIRL